MGFRRAWGPRPRPARRRCKGEQALRRCGLTVSVLLLAGAMAHAEVVVRLKNGRSIRGEVVEQDTHTLRFRTSSGILTVLKPEDIRAIEAAAPDRPPPAPTTRPSPTPTPAKPRHTDDCPENCRPCEYLFRYSLDNFCARLLVRPKHTPIGVKLGAWPALQVPACSVLGLVLLGEGDANRPGLHQRTLLHLTRYVSTWAEKDHAALKGHRTWAVAFGTLYLAKLLEAAPSASLRRKTQRMVRLLESARHGPQGWCHRFERSGYGPFVGVTLWATAAIAAAKQQGVAVDEDGLGESFAGLRRSIGPTGGASYYVDKPTLASVGRTGGVVWVLSQAPGGGGKQARRATQFLLRRLENAPHGHASCLMNFAWSALGAAAAGPDAHRRFWLIHRDTVLAARQPSGRFAVQPWKDLGYSFFHDARPPAESKGTTWPDRMYGDAWATVWFLLTWQIGRGKSVLVPPPPRPRETPTKGIDSPGRFSTLNDLSAPGRQSCPSPIAQLVERAAVNR